MKCRECKTEKNDSEFTKGKNKCKTCRNFKRRENYGHIVNSKRLRLREEFMEIIKKDPDTRIQENYITVEELDALQRNTDYEVNPMPKDLFYKITLPKPIEKGYIIGGVLVHDLKRAKIGVRWII